MATANHANYPAIDGLPLRAGGTSKAWEAADWSDLYGEGELRGDDDVIPGEHGEKHRDKQRGALRALVTVRVYGTVDSDGDPHSDPWSGLHDNLDELRAVCGPGSRTIAVFHDDVKVLEGDGEIVGGFRPRLDGAGHADVVLDVKIHAGRLTEPE